MPRTLRIATFNLENFDDKPSQKPTLAERIALMRPQLLRLNADILCLQEVNGQEQPHQPREILALQQLTATTPYSDYHTVSTKTADGHQVYDERNLVILSRFEILAHEQHRPTDEPLYRMSWVVELDTEKVPQQKNTTITISWAAFGFDNSSGDVQALEIVFTRSQ